MVKQLHTLIGMILFCPIISLAAPTLQLTRADSETELGKPLVLEIVAQGFERDLNQIDLSVLQQNFAVVIVETLSESGEQRQVMQLKLYPRQTGNLIIPALTFESAVTPVQSVTVNDAMVNGKAITVSSHVSATSLWERQQLIIIVEVKTPEKFSLLNSADVRFSAMEVIPLPASRQSLTVEGQNETILRLGWIVFPQQSGERTLQLPAVSYQLNGQIERQFYFPGIDLSVKALPPYIPPTIPVGKVSLRHRLDIPAWFNTDEVAHWHIELTSAELAPQWLPPVLRQIKSQQDIEFLPMVSQREQMVDDNGVRGKVSHDLAFKVLHNGYVELPSLRVQYFDPQLARLKTRVYPSQSVLIIDTIWLLVIVVVVAVPLFIATKKLVHTIKTYYLRHKKIQSVLQQGAHSPDVFALREVLKDYAQAQGWPGNTSMTAWYRDWQRHFHSNNEMYALLQTLSAACYSPRSHYYFEQLRDNIIRQLSKPNK